MLVTSFAVQSGIFIVIGGTMVLVIVIVYNACNIRNNFLKIIGPEYKHRLITTESLVITSIMFLGDDSSS